MTASSPTTATPAHLGKPRPLTRVILFSALTGLLYYGYYKWMIQDELKAYRGEGWSGAMCLLPFVLGILIPLGITQLSPKVPGAVGWLALLGILWIYIVQFRLYRTVNDLYAEAGQPQPLVSWWIVIPGLNLIVGLRQIYFLSEYWARLANEPVSDPIAEGLPFLSNF